MPQPVMKKIRYKVVLLPELTSTGLLHSKIIGYKKKHWNHPAEPVQKGKDGPGGLWVCNNISQARALCKYIKEKRDFETAIFICIINKILYQSSGRTKSDKVFLLDQVI